MKKTLSILIILLIIGYAKASAQFEMHRLTNSLYVPENGLSSTKITCILQDDRNFLWAGTEDGLNRFDGYNFTVFKSGGKEDSLSLGNNHVTALFQDSRKRIWVGTLSGIEYYDLEYNGFINTNLNQPEHIIRNSKCTSIMEDRNGNLWFALFGYGAVCYSPKTGASTLYAAAPGASPDSSINSNHIYSIIEDQSGKIWIASQDKGISIFNPSSRTFRHLDTRNSSLPSDIICGLYLQSNSNILISTLKGGLAIYDHRTGKVLAYPDVFTGIHKQSVFCASEDRQGNILVGTAGEGVWIFDPKDRSLVRHPIFEELSKEVGSSKVHQIYKGNFTYTWFGLDNTGLFVVGYDISGFKTMRHIPHKENTLSRGAITGITTDAGNNIWISTDGGGLNCYNRETGTFTHYTNTPGDSQSFPDNLIKDVFCDSRNRIWAGTFTGGLCLLDRETGSFKQFTDDGKPGSLHSGYVKCIREDKDGNIWVGTQGGGLARFDEETGQFKTYRTADTPGLVSDYISQLFIDSKDRLWIGSDFGLGRMDIARETFTTYRMESGLSNLSIFSMAESKDGTVWIGSANGIDRYNQESDSFTPEPINQKAYYSSVINGIIAHNDELWLSTNHGIACYTPRTGITQRHFANRGQSNEYIQGAYYESPGGEIFFGTASGLNAFFPGEVITNEVPPSVYINNLKIFNETVPINREMNGRVILEKSIEVSDKIKLRQSDKTFTLEFIAMGIYDPTTASYACKLEGFDKDWVRYDHFHRSATYTNLSPGTYKFKVRASNNPDVWDGAETSLAIVIEPAVWNTWWAKLAYFLLTALLLYVIIRNVLAQMRAKEELRIEKLKIKQQEEITDAKTNFFMNITHEFRTPLTLIIGPLKRLIEDNDPEKRKKTGLLILRNVTRLQRLINQILDVNKIEEQKMVLHVEQIELVSFVSHSISAFDDITRKKNITLTYNCHPDIINIWYDPDLLDKALNNLLYNAYKFTNEGGEIRMDIKKGEDSNVVLKVTDTGIGMDKETLQHVFERFAQGKTNMPGTGTGIGMNLTKSIVDMHKGSITAESEEGKGTVFTLTILGGYKHFSQEELVPSKDNIQAMDNDEDFRDEEEYMEEDWVTEAKSKDKKKETIKEERHTILFVEDDNDMRYYMRQELEEQYNILEAVNGRAGLQMAKRHTPDLIVTDVMMPEMDGIELAHMLKTDPETSHIPVIILTAQGDLEHRLEGLESGADSYIPKPFSIRHLKIRIRKLIELRMMMKERFSKSINMEAQEVALTGTDEKLLQNAIDYVRENIENPDLSVEVMSKDLGLSRTHLHRKLKALTGQTPVDFIKMIRMKQAAYLLSTGKLSVAEVGYKIGYNNPSYFSSSFNAYFGIYPRAYIEEAIGDKKGEEPAG